MQQWLWFSGSFALIALGLAVGVVRRNLATALAFSALTVGMGLAGFASAVESVAIWWATSAFVAAGVWAFFILFPRPLAREDGRPAMLALLCGLALSALLHLGSGSMLAWGWQGSALLATLVGAISLLATAGLVAVSLLLPLRVARTPRSWQGEARTIGIVAVSMVLFTAGTLAHIGTAARGEMPLQVAAFDSAYVLLPALLWLRATRGPHSQVARTVLVASAAIYLTSIIVGPDASWAAGRLLGGLVLAYAVLRGHIEGLDLKVQVAISRSTIAAAFIAAFFVASEGAQILFGQGNEWVGLFAAGALVFALAPLQRAAERFAERAVPIAVAASAGARGAPGASGEASYRQAVRLAVRDRRLTREEEGHLHALARDLGIDAARAHTILVEVEAEAAGGGPA